MKPQGLPQGSNALPAARAATRPQRGLQARCAPVVCSLLAAALLATSPAAQAQANAAAPIRLPSLGESASDEFGLSQEKRIGEQIMREVRRDNAYLDDPQLLEYVQGLWAPLVAAARQHGDIDASTERLFPYEVFLVRDRSVNAFALPGGYVGVHLGLIAITATPDELASVLAHELAHLTQRHIARSISAQSRGSAISLAGMLLGLLVASRAGSADMAQAAVMGSQAAMVQQQLNFSRDMEREADRTGLFTMRQAGFAPAGMPAMFDRLETASRLNDNGAFPYLRSHPLTVERIGEARQSVQSAGLPERPPAPPLLHLLMQARARALMDTGTQTWQRLQEFDRRAEMAELPLGDRLQGLVIGALASAQLRDADRAERAARRALQLLAASPQASDAAARLSLERLVVQLAIARGQPARAADLVAGGVLADGSRPGLLLQAEWALAEGSEAALRRAADAVQTRLALAPADASLWQLQSQLQARLAQPLRAVRAEAEAQAALGNLPGAIDRLRAGQQLARAGGPGTDFIEASVIDARLRALTAQRRQLLADERRGNERSRDEPPPQ